MSRCSDYETAIILAVGDHGRVTSDLTGQLKNLVSIQTAAEEACQRAVGYHGVKSANEALIKAEVTRKEILVYTSACIENHFGSLRFRQS